MKEHLSKIVKKRIDSPKLNDDLQHHPYHQNHIRHHNHHHRREVEQAIVQQQPANPARLQGTNSSSLARTSSLDPRYISQNYDLVNTPVHLTMTDDLMKMTQNWTEQESQAERRLVRFNFTRRHPTNYFIGFETIDKADFNPSLPIISCIYWKEKDLHIVTSVDVILILEYLVQDSFSIEEKNRIRRNLQSLKPYTVSRSNEECQRFFLLLMGMEDPRPRNIEKDLKVFKWSVLFDAINKVMSKYSSNRPIEETNQSLQPRVSTPINTSSYGSDVGYNNRDVNMDNTIKGQDDYIQPKVEDGNGFMPYERMKDLRKKANISSDANHPHGKHLFEHVLKPTDSVPLINYEHQREGFRDIYGDDMSREASTPGSNVSDEAKESSVSLPKSNDSTISVDDSAFESGSTGSNSDDKSGVATNSNSYDSSSHLSSNVFSNGASSMLNSSNTSGDNSVGTLKKKSKGNNVKRFAKDQGSRLFGPGGDNDDEDDDKTNGSQSFKSKYYQYPSSSQLHDLPSINSNSYDALSTSNVKLHDKELEDSSSNSNNPTNVKLPSIMTSIQNQSILDNDCIKLPPINASKQVQNASSQ